MASGQWNSIAQDIQSEFTIALIIHSLDPSHWGEDCRIAAEDLPQVSASCCVR